jgi:hypothetical protein
MLFATVVLTLMPWTGPSLPTASAAATKYKLSVRGAASERVHLRATGLPNGWVASFCTQHICLPYHYSMQLDRRGYGAIEFQAVRVDDSSPRRVRVVVSAPHANSVAANITK